MDNKLKTLKAQKTKLLNKPVKTLEQFELVQDKLNEIELNMEVIKCQN